MCIPQVQRFFRPWLVDGETFCFSEGNWLGQGRLCGIFPRLYALSTDPEISMQRAWHELWVPALPEALPDQRVDELLRVQELMAD